MRIIDLLKIIVPICSAILTGLIAYFYKQWANRIESYRALLLELLNDVDIDYVLLCCSSAHLSEAARQELRMLKPVPYFELEIIDNAIRAILKDTNDALILLKIGTRQDAESKEQAVFKLQNTYKLLRLVLKFFDEDLSQHMLHYYVARQHLRRRSESLYHEVYENKDSNENQSEK